MKGKPPSDNPIGEQDINKLIKFLIVHTYDDWWLTATEAGGVAAELLDIVAGSNGVKKAYPKPVRSPRQWGST